MPLKRCARSGCNTEYFLVTDEGIVMCALCRDPLDVVPGLPPAALDELWVAVDDRMLFYGGLLGAMKPNDNLLPTINRRVAFLNIIIKGLSKMAAKGYAAEQEQYKEGKQLDEDESVE